MASASGGTVISRKENGMTLPNFSGQLHTADIKHKISFKHLLCVTLRFKSFQSKITDNNNTSLSECNPVVARLNIDFCCLLVQLISMERLWA